MLGGSYLTVAGSSPGSRQHTRQYPRRFQAALQGFGSSLPSSSSAGAASSSNLACWRVVALERFAVDISAEIGRARLATTGTEGSGLGLLTFSALIPFSFFTAFFVDLRDVGVVGSIGAGGGSGVQYSQIVTSFRTVACTTFARRGPSQSQLKEA